MPVVFEDIIVVIAELVPNFLHFGIGFHGFENSRKLWDKFGSTACAAGCEERTIQGCVVDSSIRFPGQHINVIKIAHPCIACATVHDGFQFLGKQRFEIVAHNLQTAILKHEWIPIFNGLRRDSIAGGYVDFYFLPQTVKRTNQRETQAGIVMFLHDALCLSNVESYTVRQVNIDDFLNNPQMPPQRFCPLAYERELEQCCQPRICKPKNTMMR